MAKRGRPRKDQTRCNDASVAISLERSNKGNGTGQSRSLPIAQKGVRTASDFAALMSGLMTDVIEGNISPREATAACRAGANLLKSVELQMKYGKPKTTEQSLDLLNP